MGGTVSLTVHSTSKELGEASVAAKKPAVVSKIIFEQDIDVATALELEFDDLIDIAPRKLDQKKLKVALKHLRSYLCLPFPNGTQFLSSRLELSKGVENNMLTSTAMSSSFSEPNLSSWYKDSSNKNGDNNKKGFLPLSLRTGLLKSVDGGVHSKTSHLDNLTDNYENRMATMNSIETPGRGLLVLNTLCESQKTRSLVTSDESILYSVISSLHAHGLQRMDICENGLKIVLRCCYVKDNINIFVSGWQNEQKEWNGLRFLISILKEYGTTNKNIVEYAVSILWLAGIEIEKESLQRRNLDKQKQFQSFSSALTTNMKYNRANESKNQFGLEIFIKTILWQLPN
jgi:hypothetical protein